jgi:hypothetical protein
MIFCMIIMFGFCSFCNQFKYVEELEEWKDSRGGISDICKLCFKKIYEGRKEQHAKYYQQNRERIKLYQKYYRMEKTVIKAMESSH